MANLSKESIKKLRAVSAAILAEPEFYDQMIYPSSRRSDNCGTPCCIAGWAVWIANPDPKEYNKLLREREMFSGLEIAEFIGISNDEASRLFAGWPEPFLSRWRDFKEGTLAHARNGAARIEHFIKTDGRE